MSGEGHILGARWPRERPFGEGGAAARSGLLGPTVFIDGEDFSPPGSWRAALAPGSHCQGCGQSRCGHPDAVYQGVVPLPKAKR